MRTNRLSVSAPPEAVMLADLTVPLVTCDEQARWDRFVSEHDYLQHAPLVGERLCYAAQYRREWVALPGCTAAAVLGVLRRAVHGELHAWARRQAKARDSTFPPSERR